jgi:putative membrane protein
MKDLAKQFLTPSERENIKNTVAAAEQTTSGEIVVMVVPASYHYPTANILGATAFSLPLSLILTPLAGEFMWMGPQNMWVFLGIFALLFAGFYITVKQIPGLKRLFLSKKEIEEEVEEAALTSFYKQQLYKTRDETGVLLFVSVFEHKVWVLADRGINEKLPPDTWDKIVSQMISSIKEKRQAEAICQAVEAVGRILSQHFPIKSDDTDELKNLIIE